VGLNLPYFQQRNALTHLPGILRPSDTHPSTFARTLRTLHICETPFTITTARLLILACTLLPCLHPAWASDDSANPVPANEASAPPPVPDVKTPKPAKYDVDRIGQRNVSHGANVYSLERERNMGRSMAAVVDRGTTFITDPEVTSYVTRLAQNLARHSDAEVPFTVKIIDSLNCRVFALPGGFLYVDKGLITDLDNEAEFAGLIAHEVAHVAARHATRYATRKHTWDVLALPIIWASGPAAIGAQQIAPLNLLKFTRDAELEADLLGIQYQYAAGYDPQALVDALERLSGLENKLRPRAANTKTSLHDHIARAYASYPPTDERIQRLQSDISTLLPERTDYILDSSEFQRVKARLFDRPILRHNRSAEAAANGPVLRRPSASASSEFAASSGAITKGPLPLVFSYLPAPRD